MLFCYRVSSLLSYFYVSKENVTRKEIKWLFRGSENMKKKKASNDEMCRVICGGLWNFYWTLTSRVIRQYSVSIPHHTPQVFSLCCCSNVKSFYISAEFLLTLKRSEKAERTTCKTIIFSHVSLSLYYTWMVLIHGKLEWKCSTELWILNYPI